MRWFEKFALYIEKNGGRRDLFRQGKNGMPELYMSRYYIVKTPIFEMMLHNFHASDLPEFHDHPSSSGGIILAEGYNEHTPNGMTEKRTGSIGYRNATSFHWVELRPGTKSKVWTLFFFFKRTRNWGFLVNNQWIPHRDYFKMRNTTTVESSEKQYVGWIFPRKVKV
jgi:hypothetical protein